MLQIGFENNVNTDYKLMLSKNNQQSFRGLLSAQLILDATMVRTSFGDSHRFREVPGVSRPKY
jgi:hypothetical protein